MENSESGPLDRTRAHVVLGIYLAKPGDGLLLACRQVEQPRQKSPRPSVDDPPQAAGCLLCVQSDMNNAVNET